jgi:hypothetical protein
MCPVSGYGTDLAKMHLQSLPVALQQLQWTQFQKSRPRYHERPTLVHAIFFMYAVAAKKVQKIPGLLLLAAVFAKLCPFLEDNFSATFCIIFLLSDCFVSFEGRS